MTRSQKLTSKKKKVGGGGWGGGGGGGGWGGGCGGVGGWGWVFVGVLGWEGSDKRTRLSATPPPRRGRKREKSGRRELSVRAESALKVWKRNLTNPEEKKRIPGKGRKQEKNDSRKGQKTAKVAKGPSA